MTERKLLRYALVGLAAMACAGCTSTLQCGTWNFSGTPSGTTFPLSSSFTFDPSSCGANCDKAQDVMIQMTWVYSEDLHTNIYASQQPQGDRSDANGWAIDQLNGWAYGYYGVLNDGTLDTSYNIPGGPGTANTLFDTPGGWGANVFFYAVDVAACYKSKTCNNSLDGYYFWSYILDSSDVGQKFITAPAWKDLDQEFQSTVAAWNSWAPNSGPQNNDGVTGVSKPHAIAFPALNDL